MTDEVRRLQEIKGEINPFNGETRKLTEEIAYVEHEAGVTSDRSIDEDESPEPSVENIDWQEARGRRVVRFVRKMEKLSSTQRSERHRRKTTVTLDEGGKKIKRTATVGFVGRLQKNRYPKNWKSQAFSDPENV